MLQRLLLFITVWLLLPPCGAICATYYVSQSGSDPATLFMEATSPGNAASLSEYVLNASNVLSPGDTVYFMGEFNIAVPQYNGIIPIISGGEDGNPIYYKSLSADPAILNGQYGDVARGMLNSYVLMSTVPSGPGNNGVDNIEVEGFWFKNIVSTTESTVIYAVGTSNATFKNLKGTDYKPSEETPGMVARAGAWITVDPYETELDSAGETFIRIIDCNFEAPHDEVIATQYSGSNWQLKISGSTLNCTGCNSGWINAGSDGVRLLEITDSILFGNADLLNAPANSIFIFESNRLYNGGIYAEGFQDIYLKNNKIYVDSDSFAEAKHTIDLTSDNTPHYVEIWHNSAYYTTNESGGPGFVDLSFSGEVHGSIYNNSVSKGLFGVQTYTGTSPDDLQVVALNAYDTRFGALRENTALIGTKSDITSVDPLYTDTNNATKSNGEMGDLRLQANSPLIDAGYAIPDVDYSTATDILGHMRLWPAQGAPDLGAYEAGSQDSYGNEDGKKMANQAGMTSIRLAPLAVETMN